MRDIINYCMEQAAKGLYEEAMQGTNHACIETIKYLIPLVIEQELSGDQKRCMKLHYFEQQNQTEIARQLGITQPTVSRKLKNARKKIGKYLNYSLLAAKKTSSILH